MALLKIPSNIPKSEWATIINGSGNWFDQSSVDFWGTKVLWDSLTYTETEGVFLFITEEDDFNRVERVLTIRMFVPDRGITTMTFEKIERQEAEYLLAIGSSGNLEMLDNIAKQAWADSIAEMNSDEVE
jgi:hypothetical protein